MTGPPGGSLPPKRSLPVLLLAPSFSASNELVPTLRLPADQVISRSVELFPLNRQLDDAFSTLAIDVPEVISGSPKHGPYTLVPSMSVGLVRNVKPGE